MLAVDTEFMRTDTFYPRLGLLQIADAETQYLIDPIAIADLNVLESIFFAQKPLKVLHACGEDLEVFKCIWGKVPASLFDTQIAAAFLGFGLQLSYQNLVKQILGVDIDKGETRSDWCQRPLSEKQQLYAAQDVVYLEALYDYLLKKLKLQLRLSWVEEDCNALLSAANSEIDPEVYFLKFRHAWRLDRKRQQLLQKLCQWREQQARQRNKPRGFIIKDNDLLAIVQAGQLPASRQKLMDLGVQPRTVRQIGDQLLTLIAEPQNLDDAMPRLQPPLPVSAKPVIADLKSVAKEKALSLDLPVEVLVNRKTIEAYVMSCIENNHHEATLGSSWRNEVLADVWKQVINQHQALIKELRNYFKSDGGAVSR